MSVYMLFIRKCTSTT